MSNNSKFSFLLSNENESEYDFEYCLDSFITRNKIERDEQITLDQESNLENSIRIFRNIVKRLYHEETYVKEVKINEMLYETLEKLNKQNNLDPEKKLKYDSKIEKLKIKDQQRLESMLKIEEKKFSIDDKMNKNTSKLKKNNFTQLQKQSECSNHSKLLIDEIEEIQVKIPDIIKFYNKKTNLEYFQSNKIYGKIFTIYHSPSNRKLLQNFINTL